MPLLRKRRAAHLKPISGPAGQPGSGPGSSGFMNAAVRRNFCHECGADPKLTHRTLQESRGRRKGFAICIRVDSGAIDQSTPLVQPVQAIAGQGDLLTKAGAPGEVVTASGHTPRLKGAIPEKPLVLTNAC